MANLIEQAKTKADELLRSAYQSAAAKGILPEGVDFKGSVDIPKDTRNGDYAANHAMVSAKPMKKSPRQIAEALAAELAGQKQASAAERKLILETKYGSKTYPLDELLHLYLIEGEHKIDILEHLKEEVL